MGYIRVITYNPFTKQTPFRWELRQLDSYGLCARNLRLSELSAPDQALLLETLQQALWKRGGLDGMGSLKPPNKTCKNNGYPKMLLPNNYWFSYQKWHVLSVLGVPPFKETAIYGCFPKIGHFPPKSSLLIGFSMIFTIHFGVAIFLETPI